MASQNQIRETITNQIVEALAKGTVPWRRPWNNDPCAGAPANAVSKNLYRGVNPFILQIAADRYGFTSRYWATYKQWSDLGAQVKNRPTDVRPGQWGTQIVFCKPVMKTKQDHHGEEVEERFWALRTFTVFNVDQVFGDGVNRFRVGQTIVAPTEVEERFERAEEVVAATGADIRYGGNQAFYSLVSDYIQMPNREQFAVPEFWDTLLHELTHFTEHPSRLNWDRSKPENSYAMGELIAELGSVYLAGELGLPLADNLPNHVAYLQSWLTALKNDSRFIFKAAAQATKAADYIMSFSRTPEPEPALVG